MFSGLHLTLSYGTVGSLVMTSTSNHIYIDMYRAARRNSPIRRSLRSHKTNRQNFLLKLILLRSRKVGHPFPVQLSWLTIKIKSLMRKYTCTFKKVLCFFLLVSKTLLANYPFTAHSFHFLGKYIGVGGEARERENLFC